jgi:AcrR family transcriptional regulator
MKNFIISSYSYRTICLMRTADRSGTKGERTRARLVAAAAARFAHQGFDGTSLAEVCRDAGLSAPGLYLYFADKAALWAAAIDAELDALQVHLRASAAALDDRPFAAGFDHLVAALPQHPLVDRVLRSGSPDDLRRVLDHAVIHGPTVVLRAGLRARHGQGRLDPALDPDELALGIETIVFSLLVVMLRAGLGDSAERANAVITVLRAAAGGPPTLAER